MRPSLIAGRFAGSAALYTFLRRVKTGIHLTYNYHHQEIHEQFALL